jgi:hypothetical protein
VGRLVEYGEPQERSRERASLKSAYGSLVFFCIPDLLGDEDAYGRLVRVRGEE